MAAATASAGDDFFSGLSADEKEAAERFIHKRRAEKFGKQLGDPFTAFMLGDFSGIFFTELEANRAAAALVLGGETASTVAPERTNIYATAEAWYEAVKADKSLGELPS